tara:strand:+ start:212 stop:388 length:177 start_codon:yes stop_codon:yes gene_type:complete
MKVGDIVRVRLKTLPARPRVGIVVREERKMYMAGDVVEVMIDGKIKYVKKEHIEMINE